MRIILNTSTDPAFNLAVEEMLLLRENEDVFFLWQNRHTVVIGRNQNAWAEVDLPEAEKRGISVVRRLSGGGAVYHDLGNVNFTFITGTGEGKVDFSRFTAPILRALALLGVDARADGRNDILVGGAKISGNAQCTYRRPDGTARLLHHGTLLLHADMSALSAVLRPCPEKLHTKGIASVRSRVTNLWDVPGFAPMSAAELMAHLARTAVSGGEIRPLTEEELQAADQLRREKYGTWEWNIGKSLAHDTEYGARFPYGTVRAAYSVQGGCITSLRLWGDYFGTAPVSVLEEALVGCPVRRDALLERVEASLCPVSDCIAGASADELVSLILGERR